MTILSEKKWEPCTEVNPIEKPPKLPSIIHPLILFFLLFFNTFQAVAISNSNNIAFGKLNYQNKTWFIKKEIGNVSITDIKILKNGKLLISTDSGFYTFNGSNFKPYFSEEISKQTNFLTFNFFLDSKENVWALSDRSVFWSDGENIKTFTINSDLARYNTIVLDNNDNPWILKDSTLHYLKDNEFKPLNIETDIHVISHGKGDYLLVAYKDKVKKIDYSGKEIYEYMLPTSDNDITSIIFESKDGTLLIGKTSGLFELKDNKIKQINLPRTVRRFNSVFEDIDNNIWIGTDKTLYHYSNNSIKKVSFNNSNGFRVRGITQDSFGNLWFGSWGEGLNRLKPPVLELYDETIDNLKNFFINSDGNMWYNYYFGPLSIKTATFNHAIKQPESMSLIKPSTYLEGLNNDMWIGFESGVIHYNSKGEIQKIYSNFSGNSTGGAIIDHKQNIWFLYDYKLYFKSINNNFEFQIYKGLENKKLINILKMNKNILVQSDQKTFILDGTKIHENNYIRTFNKEFNPALTYNNTLNQLWYYDFNKNILIKHEGDEVFEYILDNKIKDFLIYNIYSVDDKNLFILGENGVIRIKQEWISQYNKDKESYLFYELMVSPINKRQECSGGNNSFSTDSNHSIYLLCQGGIFRYQAKNDIKKDIPPIPYLDTIIIAGENVDVQQYKEFKPSTSSYNFRFNSTSLNIELPFMYRYKLHGIEQDWLYTSKEYSSSYISLKPGDYAFEVQVKNTTSNWQSSNNAKYNFTVLPFFFQSLWFIVLAHLLILFVIYLIIKVRVKTIEISKIKLAKLVEEKTNSLKTLQKRELKREVKTKKELSQQIAKKTTELNEQLRLKLEAEKLLRQSQKMEVVGHLTSGIAHDFNNILSVIYMGTDIIKYNMSRNTANNDESKKWIEETINAVEKGKDVIAQLLYFAKPEEREIKPLNVNVILSDSISLIRMALPETITLKVDTQNKQDAIEIGSPEFNQIMLNLIINARDACDNNGTIQISSSTELIDSKCTSCNNEIKGNLVCISVKDNGIGIDKTKIKEIFKPFFTSKNKTKSFGIGLQVVHANVHNFGGHLIVENNKHKGVSFKIYFPKSKLEVSKLNQIKIINTPKHKDPISVKNHLLLVEDSLSLSKSIKQILAYTNISVDVANDGIEGLKLFNENPNKYGAILTDNAMPRMDGLTMIKNIRKKENEIPIIIFTGYQDDEFSEKVKKLNVSEVMQKPFNFAYLLKILKKYL